MSRKGKLQSFFTEKNFQVEYEVGVVNVLGLLLNVYVLKQLSPVAWVSDGTGRTTMDQQYLNSLRTVSEILKMYLEFMKILNHQHDDPQLISIREWLFGPDSLGGYYVKN